MASPSPPPLAELLGVLRHEPALARAAAGEDGTVVVGDAAVPVVVAGLHRFGARRPILVVTPTASDAERVAHDVGAFLPAEQVELFPAWDTLPFERVSPEVATMGQRLRVLWRLAGHPALASWGPPEIVVAPVRAVLQRLGPLDGHTAPLRVAPGDRVDQAELVARLVAMGYRREYQVEHRGELAVRGGIVDVYPSTGELPVRIDLWGDEVDRLASFDPADQRSDAGLDEVVLFACRELVPTPEVRSRAASLVEEAPWGRAQWQRIAGGELFDGIESWLPWLDAAEVLLPDLLGEHALVAMVDPRRTRDRAGELLDDETALADALAVTWGALPPPSESSGGPATDVAGPAADLAGPATDLAASAADLAGPATDLAASAADVAAPATDLAASAADRVRSRTGGAASAFPRLHAPLARLLARCPAAVLSLLPVADTPDHAVVETRLWGPGSGDRAVLAGRLGSLAKGGYLVVVCADSAGAAGRMAANLVAEGLDPSTGDGPAGITTPGVHVLEAALDRGFILPGAKLAVLAEADASGRRRPHRVARARARPVDGFFDDLAPGDYVVHRQHGVARYAGMVTRTMGGSARDYLLLEYRGDDKLYLPSDQIASLTPYSGGESPSLNRLGGSEWQRTRAKARSEVRAVAEELVALYRRRLQLEGHAFGPDTPWQVELEDSFPYVETPDQLQAVADVKADMEAQIPMDRLVCGDVGFGKTEVAVRAIFKAVQDGKQAALLVPTTLLAQQHTQTLVQRFAPFPVRVEMLSRFLTPAQAKAVVAGVADGSVDVVVGTHRLLASGVAFHRLGLLVVDEEQRFGVGHKEAMKQLAADVDVLTMTANPIPRTLEMALTGIRDLSLMSTPPAARQPILTYVGEYEEAAVVEAIRRELLREGQVFFVHNWVRDIEQVAARVRFLVPEARVAVAHGQMDEGSLEQVVLDFWERRYDVLVCTTIIESGIDMPSVNTLVVDRADRLGLGQLHQLRGRVGRSGQRAYAYLLHPADRVLSETAYERLRTIGEHTELGSGFKIAMRDLEIRGAGNLLGRDQSGHIAAVGYDLYVQLVAEAVAELKGEPLRSGPEVTIDVPSVAHLPADYVEREDLRLEAYRRLAAVTDDAEVDDIRAEWLDRFGPVPAAAEGLLEVARLRAECVRTGIAEVTVGAQRANLAGSRHRAALVGRLSPVELPASARVRLRRLHPGALLKEDVGQLVVPLPPGEDPVTALVALLRQLLPPIAAVQVAGGS